MRISDWSSDVCSSDLLVVAADDLAQQGFDFFAAEVEVPLGLRPRVRRAHRSAEFDRRAVEDPLGPGDGDARPASVLARQVDAGKRFAKCRLKRPEDQATALPGPPAAAPSLTVGLEGRVVV